MSRDASVTFLWGDDDYRFRLGIGELRQLQEKCGAGPYEILVRIAGAVWRVDDLRETIRLGLIGGGMDATKATQAIKRNFDQGGGLLQHVAPAKVILSAALIGPPDEEVGKDEAPETATTETVESSSPGSTDPEQ